MMRERYLSLLFDIPVKQAFTYRDLEAGEGEPGKRAMADFGRRLAAGFITAVSDKAPVGIDPSKIKTIRRVIDSEPLFGTEDLALAEWMAAYYFCSTGEALAAMLPSGRRTSGFASFGAEDIDEDAEGFALSAEQEAALDAICGALGGGVEAAGSGASPSTCTASPVQARRKSFCGRRSYNLTMTGKY
jgi:primosomal protein N' (replication factor Y)